METGFDHKASTMLHNLVLLLPVCVVCICKYCIYVCPTAHTTTGVSDNMWGNELLGLCFLSTFLVRRVIEMLC